MGKIRNIYRMIDYFYEVYTEVLNQHAAQKQKYVWGNNKSFMNKTLSQATIH